MSLATEVLRYLGKNVDGFEKLGGLFNWYRAAQAGRIDILEWLWFHGFPVGINDLYKSSVKMGNLETVQWIHEKISKKIPKDLLNDAMSEGDLEMAEWLHGKSGYDISMDRIAAFGHLNILLWLDKLGYRCNGNALAWASEAGHFEVVKWIYENDKEDDYRYNPNTLAKFGKIEILKWLLMKENSNSRWRWWPTYEDLTLHFLRQGDLETVKKLYDGGLCYEGALDYAISHGMLDAVIWMDENTDLEIGSEGIEEAILKGYSSMLEWIVMNHPRKIIENHLILAIKEKNLDMVKMIVNYRGDLMSRGAMRCAVKVGYLPMIRWLHRNTVWKCGDDALSIAQKYGYEDVVAWIRKGKR